MPGRDQETLIGHFRTVFLAQPEASIFRFLENGEGVPVSITNAELDRRARAVAATLQERVPAGERALIVCPPGLDYVIFFLACLYSGVIAVPVYPPNPALLKRTLPRLLGVISDADPAVVLAPALIASMTDQLAQYAPALVDLPWQVADDIDIAAADSWKRPDISEHDAAFLQYTSGSTGQPKGVVVSHANLLHNLEATNRLFIHGDPDAHMVTWLPPYHDMGLIGGLLQPAYGGFPATFMPPLAFLKRPARWLRVISDNKATISGGPDFAYDLCVAKVSEEECQGLDLSHWQLAFSGAEPVRADTLDRFTQAFAPHGFRRQAFFPCYGMAEGTLLISGGDWKAEPVIRSLDTEALAANRAVDAGPGADDRTSVGCGRSIPGQDLVIADPDSRIRLPAGQVGEIWVAGPSVANGYWRAPEATAEAFAACLSDTGEGPFLRTGDLGFLDDGELFVTGRRKDLIIIAGQNHYPQDIERSAEDSDPDLRRGCGVACSIDSGNEERLLIVHEVIGNPARLDTDRIISSIRAAVAADHDLQVHDIVLVRRGVIPKTSSGKLQRAACRAAFLDGTLDGVVSWSLSAARSARPDSPLPAQAIAVAGAAAGTAGEGAAGEGAAGEGAAHSDPGRAAEIEQWLSWEVAKRGSVALELLDPGQPISTYGLRSVDMVGMIGDLERWLGRTLPATLAWEYPTIEALANFLSSAETGEAPPPIPAAIEKKTGEPIAIIGIGCRFPGGADSPESFWQLLRDGRDAVTEVPADRWKVADFLDADPAAPGKTNTRWGGFIDGIDTFDPHFFGISAHEAGRMDPQQRLLAVTAWEALEDAGVPAERLAGSSTGVFIGIATNDYGRMQFEDLDRIDAYTGTGNALSIAANRLSYLFDLHGPSMAVDTACSSSLVAVHLACQSLAQGNCTMALAGGVNLILSPALAINFSKAGAMAPDGRCKAFDARADGYVRAEGGGVVVLKPLGQALADGDTVYGVILGGAVNQDGRTNGLMAPNPHAQEAVLRAAYADAGVSPGQVHYIEAHGTGTLLGDPIEAKALSGAVSPGRDPDQPCLIGSVKTNIGHLEAAAGIASLIKAALMVRNRSVPPSLHFQVPNPHIPFQELSLQVADSLQPWPSSDGPALVGVSAFGFGGTNAHLVIGERPEPTSPRDPEPEEQAAQLLTISARSEAALRELAARYEADLARSRAELTPRVLTGVTALRRTHHEHRLACVGSSLGEFREALGAFARQQERPGLSWGARRIARRPKVAFVFGGQGPRWWPLGSDLLESQPVLRRTLERCDALLRRQVEWSLLEQLTTGAGSRLGDPDVAQPALCALQVALAELWRSWGVEPSVVVGHSVGEIAAAQVAGALELEDALRVAVHRGQVIGRAAAGGGMAVVGLPALQAQELIDRLEPGTVSIAASNAPASTVLTGDAAALDRIATSLATGDVFYRRLESVSFASHSPAMDPLSVELGQLLTGLRARSGTVPILSTVTGRRIDGDQLGAQYWAANLRQPVLFDQAIMALAESDHDAFIEVSPHPMLKDGVRERLDLQGVSGVVVASLRREESTRAAMLSELGDLYSAGFQVDWPRILGPDSPMVTLPSYPWQQERCWADDAVAGVRRRSSGGHPLLDSHLVSAAEPKAHYWSAEIDLARLPYLRDHCVRGTAVLPASIMLDAALAAARQVLGDEGVELHDVKFTRLMLVDESAEAETLQLVLLPEAGSAGSFELFGRDGSQAAQGDWIPLAAGGFRSSAPLSSDPVADPAADPAALAQARSRCSQPLDRDEHYERLREAGLEYGEAFQGVQGLWQAPGQAIARIQVPDAITADRDPYVIHPAVLDSCLQVLGAALSGSGEALTGGKTYLPVAVERFRVSAGSARPVWAYAQIADAQTADAQSADPESADAESAQGETLSGQVVLFDEAGGRVGEIDGLVLRRLDREDDADAVADSLFEVQWRQPSDDATAPAAAPDPGAGWWLLFADSGGLAGGLRSRLAARGGTCVSVRAGERWQRTGDHEYEVDPVRREDFAALAKELRDAQPGPCAGIVHAWSLDTDLTEAGPPDLLTTAQDLGCVSVLHLVQELAEGGLGEVPRLVLLTRGVHCLPDDDRIAGEDGPPSVAQGALWGLAGVIAIEHGELHPAIIDLDPRRPADEADSLLAELTSTSPDDQICLRAGRRYRPALERWSAPPAPAVVSAPRPFDQPRDENFQIVATRPGLMESLQSTVCERAAPGPGEIEIEVSAAALNFSDVLKAMDLYPGLEPGVLPLGAECAGQVSAVGPKVDGYQVGDPVMAVARGSIAAFATTAEHLVVGRPASLSDEQAAASPIAFLTAIHGLEHLARLQPGESVLIHSATGGVGLAAIQVARRLGAQIYATAGTQQKRELLRTLGVEHVMDSRSLRFADEIMAATQGRGVDVVLNSLAGEALTRSVSVLADGGRFVEIGKQDIYANSHLGLERLKHNRSFFAVDMERCFSRQPEHVARLLRRLAQDLAEGLFTALPVTTFAMSEAEAAFTLMARAQHTGKVVLRRTGTETVTETAGHTPVRRDASYLITGGLGALGLETARYLVDQGARHLVLMGRTGPSGQAQAALDELRARVDTLTVFAGDVASYDDVGALMALIDRELPPLRGIVHAAGFLDDRLLAQLGQRSLRSVLAPKMAGGWHLHRATMNRDLDFFVLFSSVAALLGSPGQGNYAAANAFLDSLAAYRHARGLPAHSISWGPWSEIGLAAGPDRGGQLAEQGISSIRPQDGIAALHAILPTASPQVVVLPLDRRKLQAAASDGLLPRLLRDLVQGIATPAAADAGSAALRDELLAVQPGRRRRDVLTRHVCLAIGQVLKLDPAQVDTGTPLASLGFDSLMSLQLRRRLEVTLDVALPATLAWRYPTVEAIVPFLAERMGIALLREDLPPVALDDPAAGGPDDEASGQPSDTDLDELPELDIEAMLLAKMQDVERGM